MTRKNFRVANGRAAFKTDLITRLLNREITITDRDRSYTNITIMQGEYSSIVALSKDHHVVFV